MDYSDEEKKNIIKEYFSSNQSKTEFAKKFKISPPSIANWINKFGLTKEDVDIMPKDDEIIIDEASGVRTKSWTIPNGKIICF